MIAVNSEFGILNSELPRDMLGLYLHIPFCSAICNYCNFNRGLFDAALKERYVEALMTEIARGRESTLEAEGQRSRSSERGWGPARIKDSQSLSGTNAADTIYFGGGTPSLLEPDEVRRIIQACGQAFD